MFINKLNEIQNHTFLYEILKFTLMRLRFIATKSFRVCSVKFITVSLYYTYKKPVLIVSRGRGYLKPITAKLSEIEPF